MRKLLVSASVVAALGVATPARVAAQDAATVAGVLVGLTVLGALALDAFFNGAEHISEITAHLTLIGYPRQAACARQNCKQRCLGQRHGR